MPTGWIQLCNSLFPASIESLDYIGRMGISNMEAIDTTRSLVRMLETQWKEHMIVCVGQEQEEEEATTVTTKVENKLLTAVSRWQLLELDLGLQCRNVPSICPINTCLHWTSYTGMTNSSRQQQFLWQPTQSPDSSRLLWRNNKNKASKWSIQRCEHIRIPSISLSHWLRLHDTMRGAVHCLSLSLQAMY